MTKAYANFTMLFHSVFLIVKCFKIDVYLKVSNISVFVNNSHSRNFISKVNCALKVLRGETSTNTCKISRK